MNQAPAFSAAELMGELEGGLFDRKLSIAFKTVAGAVCDIGRGGVVTVKFAFKRIGESRQVMVTHTIEHTRPTVRGSASEDDATQSPLYVGPGGVVSVIPFNQGSLFGNEQEPASNQEES